MSSHTGIDDNAGRAVGEYVQRSGKAWTAAFFQRPSIDYSAPSAPGGGAHGILNAYPGKLVPLPGGQPILIDGACIGGIGVSGATGEQDDGLAKAAVAALVKEWGGKA